MIRHNYTIIYFWIILAFFLGTVTTVTADDKRTIQGQITLVKGNMEIPLEEVELNIFISPYQDDMSIIRTLTDTAGEFKIENILTSNSLILINFSYDNIDYSQPAELTDSAEKIQIKVYEQKSDYSEISIKSQSMIIVDVDPSNEILSIMEMVNIHNPTQYTIVPDSESVMSLLRFSLPEQYFDLDIQSSLPIGNAIEVNKGFGMTNPIPPGTNEVIYSYRIIYDKKPYQINRKVSYPIDNLLVLIPDGIGSINNSSSAFKVQGIANIGSRNYNQYEFGDFKNAETIDIIFDDLPSIGIFKKLIQHLGNNPLTFIPIALGIITIAALIIYVVLSRHKSLSTMSETDILSMIANLDNTYQNGDINETIYLNKRAHLKNILLDKASKNLLPENEI
ncbi:MAG: hypothetical protein FI695_06725 [SAR202 cluster bacterium]|nr:hypothetical protein [SAR202 cluster bacterium]|tara:strand:+ start:15373 stop:16551 length:1179 start_codon:yes stop_codon:yes gene_type:complete